MQFSASHREFVYFTSSFINSKYNITNHRKLHLYNNKMFNQSVAWSYVPTRISSVTLCCYDCSFYNSNKFLFYHVLQNVCVIKWKLSWLCFVPKLLISGHSDLLELFENVTVFWDTVCIRVNFICISCSRRLVTLRAIAMTYWFVIIQFRLLRLLTMMIMIMMMMTMMMMIYGSCYLAATVRQTSSEWAGTRLPTWTVPRVPHHHHLHHRPPTHQ